MRTGPDGAFYPALRTSCCFIVSADRSRDVVPSFRLLPFSRAELTGRPIRHVARFPTTRRSEASKKSPGSEGLFEALFAGGYPQIHDKGLQPQAWLANYWQTYLERDVRDLPNVGDAASSSRRSKTNPSGRRSFFLRSTGPCIPARWPP